MSSQSLIFDIDADELDSLGASIGATASEIERAYKRALARTRVTMQARSNRLIRDSMDARSIRGVKKRMQAHQKPGLSSTGAGFGELKLWYGLNAMPLNRLKGRVSRLGNKRSPKGAIFRSKKLGDHEFEDGFIARMNGQRSIYMRDGPERFPASQAKIDIADNLHVDIEDNVFDQLPEVFRNHFQVDLKGRVAARDIINPSRH